MTVPEYEWGTRSNSQIIGSYLVCRQICTNYCETSEILSSHWIIQPNASKISIIVILVVKAKFSTTGNSKVSTNNCDINEQPEIAMWPLKTGNIYISGTMIEIPKADLWFSITPISKKLCPGDCDNDRQAENSNIHVFSAHIPISGCPSLSQSLGYTFIEHAMVENARMLLKFQCGFS